MGRKYDIPEVLEQKINEYFSNCDKNPIITKTPNGTKETPRPYTVEGLCNHLKITRDTLLEYSKLNHFSDIIKNAKDNISTRLQELSLSGDYNATMAIFSLKNHHEWKDKHEVEHSGDLKITIDGSLEDFSD